MMHIDIDETSVFWFGFYGGQDYLIIQTFPPPMPERRSRRTWTENMKHDKKRFGEWAEGFFDALYSEQAPRTFSGIFMGGTDELMEVIEAKL